MVSTTHSCWRNCDDSWMSLQEVNEVASVIGEIVADDANIIFGTSVDDSFGDEISVTLVATSLPGVEKQPELEVVPEYKVVPSPLHNGHNGHHLNGAHKNGAYKAR